jgi:hypothetical protein
LLTQAICSAEYRNPGATNRGALFLTLALSAPRSYQAPSLTAGERCRMTELLIGLVSWLATLGFIVAAIAEVFR